MNRRGGWIVKKTIVVGRSRYDEKMDMAESHFHDRYEIYYLLSGERFYFIDHRMHFVQAGDLVFIDRYALHQTRDTGISHHERILIEFPQEFLEPLYGELAEILPLMFRKGGYIIRLQDEERRRIEAMLFEILSDAEGERKYAELHLKLQLAELLIRAARITPQTVDHRDVFHPTLREIISWISVNFRNPDLKLEDVSEKFAISKYYLCRLFKQDTGYTFTHYVNLLRIREAQRLLRETDEKVVTISEMAGFENLHHFCRVFKQISRVSPLQYRKNHLKEMAVKRLPDTN